jgi:hypothetical protein
MPKKSEVAILSTRPDAGLSDPQRLFEPAGGSQALAPNAVCLFWVFSRISP